MEEKRNYEGRLDRDSSVVIIGASGYLGCALYKAARKFGLVIGTSVSDDKFLRLSLDEPENFDYDVVNEGDIVYMAAGISAPGICSQEPERAWKINVEGTSAVISNVLSAGARVIFLSSDTVYGERDEEVGESASCRPEDDYAVMKREVEGRFAERTTFKAIRLSFVFSYGDKFTAYLRGCADRRNVADVFHPFRRAVVHRDDVTEGMLVLGQRWNQFDQRVINFGGPEVISRIQFARTLRETVLPDLRYQSVDPGADFFKCRPRTIRMRSSYLASLLGRPSRSLRVAARLEFSGSGEAGRG